MNFYLTSHGKLLSFREEGGLLLETPTMARGEMLNAHLLIVRHNYVRYLEKLQKTNVLDEESAMLARAKLTRICH